MTSRLVLLVFFLSAVVVTSCEPGWTNMIFVNETQQELVLYRQSNLVNGLIGVQPVPPGTSFDDRGVDKGYSWLRVAAVREDGQWVFDHTYTRDELEKAQRRVVVSSLEVIAPPADVPVFPYGRYPTPVLAPTKPALPRETPAK